MSRRQRAAVGAGLVAAALALLAVGAPDTTAPPRRWDCERPATPTGTAPPTEVTVAEVVAVVAERRRQP